MAFGGGGGGSIGKKASSLMTEVILLRDNDNLSVLTVDLGIGHWLLFV